MNTGTRHYWHGRLVRDARKPRHTMTVRFNPPATEPRPRPSSLEEQIACAKTTAARYRQLAAMGGRPVRVIQMERFAQEWEERVKTLEARRHGRQQEGELFTGTGGPDQ